MKGHIVDKNKEYDLFASLLPLMEGMDDLRVEVEEHMQNLQEGDK